MTAVIFHYEGSLIWCIFRLLFINYGMHGYIYNHVFSSSAHTIWFKINDVVWLHTEKAPYIMHICMK